jgi:hypothetical protein
VITFTSCLPMVRGSLRVLRLLPPLKLVAIWYSWNIAERALNTINQSIKIHILHYYWNKRSGQYWNNGFIFRHKYSCQVKVEVRSTKLKVFTWVQMRKKKPVISNTGNLFCFNSYVSNLYNNDVIIYKIKKVVRTVCLIFLSQHWANY